MFGCGSVAQVVLSRGSHGTFLSVNLAFGLAVTLGVLVSGQISGEDTRLDGHNVHSLQKRHRGWP